MDKLNFTTIDYLIFALMMGLSTIIGLYYGFFAKQKQNNTEEYLLGSKSIGILPISASIIATRISATIIIGIPAEIYKFGSQYYITAICGLLAATFVSFVYLPVFHELQTISCYTYLEQRFNKQISKFASFLFFIYVVILSPLLIYTPALAFSQVSGINLHIITVIICCICIFYTTVGGLRGVVWNDTLQFIAMIGALISVIIIGTVNVGGVTRVFELADKGHRLVWFNLNPDPFIRNSFWMMTFGLGTLWMFNIGVSQECVQRYLSIRKLKDAQKVVFVTAIGNITMKMASVYIGLLIYAKYSTCDPYFDKKIEKYDQIVSYFVLDITRHIPGLSGLFIVGVLSAALSTISSSLNSIAGTIYHDFIKPSTPNATEKQSSFIMKLLVVGTGLLCFALIFVIERLGAVFNIGVAFSGICGTILGLFSVGMLSRNFNSKGAMVGSIASVLVVGFIAVGAQVYIFQKKFKYSTLPFDVSQCSSNQTYVESSTFYVHDQEADLSQIPWIFKINFTYYTLIGVIVLIVVGYPISILTGKTKDLNEALLAPFLRRENESTETTNFNMEDIFK